MCKLTMFIKSENMIGGERDILTQLSSVDPFLDFEAIFTFQTS